MIFPICISRGLRADTGWCQQHGHHLNLTIVLFLVCYTCLGPMLSANALYLPVTVTVRACHKGIKQPIHHAPYPSPIGKTVLYGESDITKQDITEGDSQASSSMLDVLPTVRGNLGQLTAMTRPDNIPGILFLHSLGVYLAVKAGGNGSAPQFWKLLLTNPQMWLVLASLVLVSSTSMVVNDYYDAKLGRDANRDRPLALGTIPLPVARTFASDLYAALLLCVPFLPGVPARLTVVLATMLTYLYTRHLKPKTWIKNIVCASIIAMSPYTSFAAALFLVVTTSSQGGASLGLTAAGFAIPELWQLVSALFFGIMAREMIMDCSDVEDDRAAHVRTVPVVYGTNFASRVAFAGTCLMMVAAVSVPLVHCLEILPSSATTVLPWTKVLGLLTCRTSVGRRLVLASVGALWQVVRSWQVFSQQGTDKGLNGKAVHEGALSLLLLLASFVA